MDHGQSATKLLSVLGRRIRARRLLAGMTQHDLAAATSRTRSSIANIEAGRQSPPFTLVEEIAAALDVTVAELIATSPAPEDPSRIPALGFNTAELYRRLDAKRVDLGLTWREVAHITRVSPSTFSRVGAGQKTDVTGLVRLLVWLGDTDLTPYVIGQEEDNGD
jgi:transcriptional regulator with XRE-family HTH domain